MMDKGGAHTMAVQNDLMAIVGSYAEPDQPGLYVCRFDSAEGTFEVLDQVSGLPNPTFVAVDSAASRVYAITEETDAEGRRCGAAAAFDLDRQSGRLSLLGKEITVPATTCHISLDQNGRYAAVSSYHGGMIGLSPILPDGRVGPASDIQQHQGASVLPVQDRPRAHSVLFDRSNRYAVACDLGLDRIFVYRLDADQGRLLPHGEIATRPGSGPRHFAFHPSAPYGYAIHELNATITAYRYDEEQGRLTKLQTLSTLPESYDGVRSCADIHLSPDGRFLYGSNRGHDSIAVYGVGEDGRLTPIEYVPTLGGHPRNFAITPDGRCLTVANRDGNNIVTFSRDERTGMLTPRDQIQLSKPVCIRFVQG
jgi:6-phosphogluconolactonase